MSVGSELPNIALVIGPLLAGLRPAEQPLLIALAERMAAERYRGWAARMEPASRRAELFACAEREEEIATRVEALFPDAAEIQARLLAGNLGLAELNRTIFAGRPRTEQFSIQAQGERAGAATWRSFARTASPEARRVYLECAELEERSAAVLESLLAGAD